MTDYVMKLLIKLEELESKYGREPPLSEDYKNHLQQIESDDDA